MSIVSRDSAMIHCSAGSLHCFSFGCSLGARVCIVHTAVVEWGGGEGFVVVWVLGLMGVASSDVLAR